MCNVSEFLQAIGNIVFLVSAHVLENHIPSFSAFGGWAKWTKSSFRCQNHDQGSAFKFGVLLHHSDFLGLLGYFFEQCHTEPGQSDFASPKYDGHFYLVFSINKLPYMANLGLQIMISGLRAYLDLLYLKWALFLFCFLFLFGLLVAVATIIHNLANRRFRVGRNLYQVQTKFSRSFQSLSCRNNTDLFAIRVYNSYFPGPNVSVDVRSIWSYRSIGSSWCSYVLPPRFNNCGLHLCACTDIIEVCRFIIIVQQRPEETSPWFNTNFETHPSGWIYNKSKKCK